MFLNHECVDESTLRDLPSDEVEEWLIGSSFMADNKPPPRYETIDW